MRKAGKIRIAGVTFVVALACFGCAGSPAVPTPGPSAPEKLGEQEKTLTFESKYRAGISSLQAGNLEEARGVLEILGREMPGSLEVRNALGVLYRNLGQTEKAISEYRAAFSILEEGQDGVENPGLSAHLSNNLGIALRENGDFKEAEQSYQAAIRLDPRFPDSYYNLGVLYDLYMGRSREALKFYKKFLSLSGKDKKVELWVKDLELQQKRRGGSKAREKW